MSKSVIKETVDELENENVIEDSERDELERYLRVKELTIPKAEKVSFTKVFFINLFNFFKFITYKPLKKLFQLTTLSLLFNILIGDIFNTDSRAFSATITDIIIKDRNIKLEIKYGSDEKTDYITFDKYSTNLSLFMYKQDVNNLLELEGEEICISKIGSKNFKIYYPYSNTIGWKLLSYLTVVSVLLYEKISINFTTAKERIKILLISLFFLILAVGIEFTQAYITPVLITVAVITGVHIISVFVSAGVLLLNFMLEIGVKSTELNSNSI